MGGRQVDCDAVRQWFGSLVSCSVLDAIRTGYPPCLQLLPRSEQLAVLDSVAYAGGLRRLGRMQSAACSPAAMHLLQSVCGLFCIQCLVLHVPWFDLAARLLRVWPWDGMKLTKSCRRSCRGSINSRRTCCNVVLSRSMGKTWHQPDWPWIIRARLGPIDALIQPVNRSFKSSSPSWGFQASSQ